MHSLDSKKSMRQYGMSGLDLLGCSLVDFFVYDLGYLGGFFVVCCSGFAVLFRVFWMFGRSASIYCLNLLTTLRWAF